jgi:hypothetical protein
MDTSRNIASRQYPRIPLDNPAQLEIVRHLRKRCQWDPLSVTIRTASCEGVGLVLHDQTPEPLLRRDKVLLSLKAGNAPINIPGHVVWSNQGESGDMDLGIRLDLAFARAVDRRIYSSWVVANIVTLRDVLHANQKS